MSTTQFSVGKLLDVPDTRREAPRLLRLYLLYRLSLAVGLALALLLPEKLMLGQFAPGLHSAAVAIYLAQCVLSLALNHWGKQGADLEYAVAIFVDALFTSLLTHTSGGPQSSLGLLLGVSIAIAALGMSGRIALFGAAAGTLAMFAEAWYSISTEMRTDFPYTRIALLGMAYFALAMLAHRLTARAQASEALALKQELDIADLTQINEYVIQQIQTGIIVLDSDHKIRMLNDAAWALVGTPDVAIGHTLPDISLPLAKIFLAWREAPSHKTYHLHTLPQGDNLEAHFSTIGNEESRGTLIFLEDASKAAEAAQQIKLASLGRLIASIAHEIRNPLGAISHASQLLEESPDLESADKRMIEIIKSNSGRLNEVIENILALSRRHTPIPERIWLKPYLQNIIREAQNNNRLESSQFVLQVASEDQFVFADKQQLTQIVTALLDNSVRHFPLELSHLQLVLVADIDEKSRQGFLELTDNGSGIAADIAPRIFDPFFTTRRDGTGLGLYVVKELCDLNNIKISFQPVKRGGACFRLKFQNTGLSAVGGKA